MDEFPRDFPNTSSPLTEREAFGNAADRLGDAASGLRRIATEKLGRNEFAHAMARTSNALTCARDALRGVALLRSDERYIALAALADDLRASYLGLSVTKLTYWPARELCAIAAAIDFARVKIMKLKDAPEPPLIDRTLRKTPSGIDLTHVGKPKWQ
ncbi:MAG TPA: hypothetical protein VNF04_12140 [Stellaceae bacterium]|nr:hypothetical protein [Stellaceae bacterium]